MSDQYFRYTGGTIIVRPSDGAHPWLLTWLPDASDDPSYPGFTITPADVEFPTQRGVGGVLEWAARQEWTRTAAGEEVSSARAAAPENARPIPVPAEEYAAFSERLKLDFGWNVAFSPEPDGSYSWAVIAEDGTELRSGVSDSWDDARLDAIDGLTPPNRD